jgi:hypothetical protein
MIDPILKRQRKGATSRFARRSGGRRGLRLTQNWLLRQKIHSIFPWVTAPLLFLRALTSRRRFVARRFQREKTEFSQLQGEARSIQ